MKSLFKKLTLLWILICSSVYVSAQGEYIKFSLYHNNGDAANTFRIKLQTDNDAYWTSNTDPLTYWQVPIRVLDADGISLSASTAGGVTQFTTGTLTLDPAIDDPIDSDYDIFMLYYDGGNSSPSGGWAQNTEYDLARVTITAGTVSTSIQLAFDDAFGSVITSAEINNLDDVTNYTTPFYGTTSSSGGYQYVDLPAAALPVSLTFFNAIPQSGIDAKLTWQTATEENNRGFYVERSVDGRNWEVVNFVPSMAPGGNSHILVDYQFLDMNVYKPQTGISTWYYQLRQQDINGEEEYVGGIRAVRFNESGAAAVINVYPNPATSLVTISVKDGAPVQYTIVDMTGKSVLRGAYTQTIDVSKLQSGSYQVSVFDITGATLGTQNITVAR